MKSHSSGRRPRRSRGGSRRRGDRPARFQDARPKATKKTFWQRLFAFFGDAKGVSRPAAAARNGSHQQPQQQQQPRPSRKPESVEVTSPRLYVGNLSFDATE